MYLQQAVCRYLNHRGQNSVVTLNILSHSVTGFPIVPLSGSILSEVNKRLAVFSVITLDRQIYKSSRPQQGFFGWSCN